MKNNLPHWVAPVLIVLGVGLLTTAAISYFVASQTEDSPPTPTQITSTIVDTPTAVAVVDSSTTEVATNTPLPPTPIATDSASPTPVSTQTAQTESPVITSVQSDEIVVESLDFEGESAYQHVLNQVAIGPRPTGSEAGWATGDVIMTELEKLGWSGEAQEFLFKGVRGRNIISKKGSGPIIIIGAHYDTRPAADQDPTAELRDTWIEGGNDGASGVAVLLELARTLELDKLNNEVWLAFFDAEDRGRLAGWPFSVGARHMAENLTLNPQAVVVVDMIGDADQQLYYEHNSTDELSVEIWAIAGELGYADFFIPEFRHTIIDDHLPFLERAIPAVDIIDFDYPYWHTVEDTADKVSPESLERIGRTLEVWLEEKQ